MDDQEHVPLPSSFYASTEDPKPKHQNFRVGGGGGGRKPLCIYFSFLKQGHAIQTRLHTVAAVSCLHLCLVVLLLFSIGQVRPEVFMAAVSVARGIRRSFGLASTACFYSNADAITTILFLTMVQIASCELPLPTHYIMAWYSSGAKPATAVTGVIVVFRWRQ